MIKLIGFNGPSPYSRIFWEKDGEIYSKTICYSQEEEQMALARFKDPNDFYHSYDKAIVIRNENANHHLIVTKAA